MTGEQLAARAGGLVGAPFRLHGRDPSSGLDCVGVLAAAMGQPDALPNGYSLRMRQMPRVVDVIDELGLMPTSGAILPGDVLMLRPSRCQFHFAIAIDAGSVVHAHAGLRKVVLGPLPREWPIAAHWRLKPQSPDR